MSHPTSTSSIPHPHHPSNPESDQDQELDDDHSIQSLNSSSNSDLTDLTELTSPIPSPKFLRPDLSSSALLHPSSVSSNHSGPGWYIGQAQSKPNVHSHQSLYHQPLHSSFLVNKLPNRAFDLDPNFLPRPLDPHCLRHSEFGHAADEAEFLWESKFRPDDTPEHENEDAGYFTYLTAYWSYLLVFVIG